MPAEVTRTHFTVKQTTDSVELDTPRGDFDEPKISVNDIPRASFMVHDPSGVYGQSVVKEGKEFEIRRGVSGVKGERRFLGVIENVELKEDEHGTVLTARGVHKGYKMLQQHVCDDYDFDEDGLAETTRDAVTINPWRFFIFRKAGGVLDSRGLPLPIDGVKFNDVVKHIIGTKFIHQMDLQDNTYFLASGIYASTNKVQVYRDGVAGDLRPALQRLRKNGSSFLVTGAVETVPLENGSPNVDAMGTISSVTVTLIGIAVDNPTVYASRNARDGTRQYTTGKNVASTNILEDDAVTDTGLDKWVLTFSGADWPGSGSTNSLGLKIDVGGADGDAATTKIYYIKVECVTTSDTGLSEGTIDTYDNPVVLRSGDIDDGDWVDSDFLTLNRLEALEKLRALTESVSSNPSPHWDSWIDSDLAVHFKERRGSDVTTHDYSFTNENLRVVNHRFIGNEIAYQTIAYGAGSGTAQTRIVSKEEFSSGGLYDVNRDPAGGALYGQLARVMKFVDANEKSTTALYRKARAFHKLHRDPQEQIDVVLTSEFIRYFETGDSIRIKNLRTRTNGLKRVNELNRGWNEGSEEVLRVVLGNPVASVSQHVANTVNRHETLVARAQPSLARTGVSGDAIYCTKDIYGLYSFGVPEGIPVERVLLKVSTVPWTITSNGTTATLGVTESNQATNSGNVAPDVAGTAHLSGALSTTGRNGHDLLLNFGTIAAGSVTECLVELKITLSGGVVLYEGEVLVGEKGTSREFQLRAFLGTSFGGQTVNVNFVNRGLATSNFTSGMVERSLKTTPNFGVWQFDGDSGSGTGNPKYGSEVMIAVDPTVSAAGIPTDFTNERIPIKFGAEAASQAIEVDVTGFLDVDANGIIKSGEHRVYLLATASASNAQGLAAVSVTPILRFREVKT